MKRSVVVLTVAIFLFLCITTTGVYLQYNWHTGRDPNGIPKLQEGQRVSDADGVLWFWDRYFVEKDLSNFGLVSAVVVVVKRIPASNDPHIWPADDLLEQFNAHYHTGKYDPAPLPQRPSVVILAATGRGDIATHWAVSVDSTHRDEWSVSHTAMAYRHFATYVGWFGRSYLKPTPRHLMADAIRVGVSSVASLMGVSLK